MTSKKIVDFSRGIVPGSERKKAVRKRAKRAPVTTGDHVPERAANPAKQSSRQVRTRTAEDIANEQTAEQLALRICAAMVAHKVLSSMSVLMDELIQSHLLDDDDEEGDEGWLDDHRKREKTILDEAIVDALDKYPDFKVARHEEGNERLCRMIWPPARCGTKLPLAYILRRKLVAQSFRRPLFLD